jgi:hypothetical protein
MLGQNRSCLSDSFKAGARNMKRPFSTILPVAMGVLSVALIAWDIQNQHVIRSMGMAWDTGAPLWPYQTPDTLLFALNTPAYLLIAPTPYWTFGFIGPLHYVTFLPALLLWWWVVGMFFDQWRSKIGSRKGWVWTSLLLFVAVLLMSLGVSGMPHALRWWWTYSRQILSVSDLILLRLIAPSIWCFVLCFAALQLVKRRIFSGRHAPPD